MLVFKKLHTSSQTKVQKLNPIPHVLKHIASQPDLSSADLPLPSLGWVVFKE